MKLNNIFVTDHKITKALYIIICILFYYIILVEEIIAIGLKQSYEILLFAYTLGNALCY